MNTSTNFIKKPLVAAMSGILAGTVAPAVQAQSNGESAGMLEEIVVTASRREQNIQDIPYNISAVQGEEIAAQNIVDTSDLMRTIAGVSVIDRGYRNSGHVNSLIIRGINVDNGANGDIGLSSVSPVATYVDNTPLFANFLLKDIDRVEVLRGPQGTLYGSGALGGTVRYLMNRPDASEFDASVAVTYGQTDGSDGNNVGADIVLNVPLSETTAFRLSAGTVQNDGVIDYVNLYQIQDGKPVVMNDAGQCVSVRDPGLTNNELAFNGSCYESKTDVDDVDITYARASLRFQPSEDLDIQLNYQMQEDEVGGRRTITLGADYNGNVYNGSDESGSTMLEPSEREAELMSLDLEWNLGFATMTSSTSSYTHEGDGWRDNTSLWVTDRGGFANWFDILYPGNPRPVAHVSAGFDEEAFVQEFRLVSNDSDSNIDWTVGAYYMDQDREVDNFSYLLGLNEYGDACTALGAACPDSGQWWMGAPLSEIDFYYIRRENFTDLAIYGEVTWHVADNWHITAGARWFDNELTNDTAMDFPLFEGVVVPFNNFPSQKEDDVQLKFNVAWDVNDSTMAYFTYSEGFRRGGANAIPSTGFFAELNPETVMFYKADTVENFEIGLKGTTERVRYSADIYYVDWNDPQLNTASAWWGFFMAQNGESAATTGIELEAQILLSDNLHLDLGYGHVDAELTADLINPQTGSVSAPDGHRLPGTAEDTATATLRHSLDMSNGLNLTSRLGYYYQSDSINSVTDGSLQARFPGFSIWNASATLSNENWSAALWGRNLGNDAAVTGNYPSTYMSTDTGIFENYYGNNQREYIATPRTIGLTVTYNF
ncbi:MAG: TonB-dependent receptor [Gammaproteobacteria bacterium]|nr:TonB-dependent receptor [Gammaproteobacteria bacterium]MDH5239167.1 TonB-dependent receptor [Gammaproteobacteria bacterium]MDH5260338.1 TonB-dependent receptor [Gammaproteobacteria bacterium]MDH5582599.1 TonB-dependent receptor [Gammaproteobacteria bacterium]